MGTQNQLFKIDTLLVDGVALPFEDGSAEIEGAAGFTNDVKVSASGDDYVLRKRVPRYMMAKLQYNGSTNVASYSGLTGVQIAMRDTFSGRKALANNCTFVEIGKIGAGTVDVKFAVLTDIQWL